MAKLSNDELLESFIHVEVDRQSEAAELEAEIESYMVTSEGNPQPARQAL